MTFEEVFASYMIVSGTERGAAYQDRLMFRFFVSNFGKNFPIIDITPRLISRCLAVLRGKLITRKGVRVPLAPATINKHTQFLQRVFNHALDLHIPVQPIRWKAFIVVEPEAQISPLTEEEEMKVISEIDPAIRPLFQFSMLTGVRLANAIQLRWNMVDWKKKTITFRGKSRRPGGKTYIIPLTTSVVELLKSLEGHHKDYVFTYVAKRNDKHGHHSGRRYHLTCGVTRYYWERLALGKRWHDVRHTFGTRLYGISKDVHLVQRAMNHSNIQTTLRYVHQDHTDVAEAMEKLPRSFINVNERSGDQHTPDTNGQNSNVIKLKDNKVVRSGRFELPRLSALPPQDDD